MKFYLDANKVLKASVSFTSSLSEVVPIRIVVDVSDVHRPAIVVDDVIIILDEPYSEVYILLSFQPSGLISARYTGRSNVVNLHLKNFKINR